MLISEMIERKKTAFTFLMDNFPYGICIYDKYINLINIFYFTD